MTSFIILATLSLSLFCICQADLVSNDLFKPIDLSLQVQATKPDSKPIKADPRALAQSIAQKAIIATQNVVQIAKSVGGEIADTCVETSSDGIDNLNKCIGYLKNFNKGVVDDLKTRASAALTDVSTCDDEFEGGREPAKLKAATQKAEDLISSLLSIVNQL